MSAFLPSVPTTGPDCKVVPEKVGDVGYHIALPNGPRVTNEKLTLNLTGGGASVPGCPLQNLSPLGVLTLAQGQGLDLVDELGRIPFLVCPAGPAETLPPPRV